jgi:Rrf2 family iron-sulfur cluster assembly transcriptional regulator
MRLEITRRADLAVRAMTALAAADGRMKSGDLADALGTTTGMVPQVVGPLVKAGWVRSDPGPTGGYRLVTRIDGVSVLDVIEAVDGPTDNGRCVVADRACDARNRCALHDAWTHARGSLTASLDATSLDAIAVRRPRRTASTGSSR